MRTRDWLFIVGAIIIAVGFVSVAHSTEVRFENCDPYSMVGGVKWEWKDGIRGNYVGSDYHDVPEIDLKGVGTLVVDLEPGDYAITHYRPAMRILTEGNVSAMVPAAILDFQEIEVGDAPITLYFGCE